MAEPSGASLAPEHPKSLAVFLNWQGDFRALPYFDQWRMTEVQETEGNASSFSDMTGCFCLFLWLNFWAHYCVTNHVSDEKSWSLLAMVRPCEGQL